MFASRSIFGAFAVAGALAIASPPLAAMPAFPDVGAAFLPLETVQFGGQIQQQQQRRVVPNQQAPNRAAPPKRGGGGNGNAVGAAVAAGVLGAVIGGAIASQSRPEPVYPREEYRPERRRGGYAAYDEDVEQGPPPRSRAWYDYCSRRYRSFDPRSGTFVTPDGVRVFCR